MSGGYQPEPGPRPQLPNTGSGVKPAERSLVTNCLTFLSTADRIAAMPAPSEPYVAPDQDPA